MGSDEGEDSGVRRVRQIPSLFTRWWCGVVVLVSAGGPGHSEGPDCHLQASLALCALGACWRKNRHTKVAHLGSRARQGMQRTARSVFRSSLRWGWNYIIIIQSGFCVSAKEVPHKENGVLCNAAVLEVAGSSNEKE
ncbi:uncharacterized protein MCYG_08738 [Microsporum canis CBS 113480]|uniref:Uncharacterized protein n=1 Tax=Arthroderma otae (strain ATCC MYA-4605 / CBS 113480) TaxID=554155 RepID=C5G1B6_ARTOC|nr:uncharacterized protein MCYG_08738 [Microsporum canis CBS 113480]EEQ28579.1 predicted protein [Microsporum canis CBS 113480]